MYRYIKPEINRLNQAEEERQARYVVAQAEWKRNYADMESAALRSGLGPVEVPTGRLGNGLAELSPGTWWIAGTRQLPGLTYYWQEPVTVKSSATASLALTESNALVIEGGW